MRLEIAVSKFKILVVVLVNVPCFPYDRFSFRWYIEELLNRHGPETNH